MKDFLAVGDITIDDFIYLESVEIVNKKMCMPWGDKIPFTKSIKVAGVGNAPNASVAASRLGLDAGIITHVGDDDYGEMCIKSLQEKGVSIDLVEKHKNKQTNFHYVLSYEGERTILVKHEDFDYKDMQIPECAKMIYLSSVGRAAEGMHKEMANYVEKNPSVSLAFQPGTFQLEMGVDKILPLYKVCDLFFCNVEEAKRILNIDSAEIKDLLNGINKLGPKTILITDGPRGAYMYSDDTYWFMPPYPDPAPPKERTGAGDAFSSTFASFIAKGKSPIESLTRAPISSMSVVQDIGAQKGLLTEEQIEVFLSQAPENYRPKKI